MNPADLIYPRPVVNIAKKIFVHSLQMLQVVMPSGELVRLEENQLGFRDAPLYLAEH